MPDGTRYRLDGVDPRMDDAAIRKIAVAHHRKANADAYANAPDSQMILQSERDSAAYGGNNPNGLERFGLGLKHSLNRSYSGLKSFFTDLSKEDKLRLQQGDAFVKQNDGFASAGQIVGDIAPDIALAMGTKGLSFPLRAGYQGMSSYLRTPGDTGDRAIAGGVSMLGEGVGTALSAALRNGAKAVEPFYKTGRERIVNRTLNNAYTGEGSLLDAITNGNREIIQGVKPTTAQAVLDPGISRLTDSFGAKYSDIGNALKNSDINRNTAYQTLMQNIAGTPENLALAEAFRKNQARADFGAANGTQLLRTPELDATAASLSMNPFVKDSIPAAKKLAQAKFYNDPANAGKVYVEPDSGQVSGLSFIGKTLGDKTGAAYTKGNTGMAEVLGDTRDSVVNYLRAASPLYAEAVDNYARNSRPINQMKVGDHMYNSMFPAIVDEAGTPFRATMNSFLNAKRNGDKVVQGVTKMKNKTMDEVLEPWQTQVYDDIGLDIGRAEAAKSLGVGGGSQTAARLSDAGALNGNGIVSNILRAGAYTQGGLVGGQAADAVIGAGSKRINDRIAERLGEAIIDPNVAAAILRNTRMKPGFFLRETSKNRGLGSGLFDSTFNHMPNQFPGQTDLTQE
jgi:hypothetical protein